MNCKTGFIISRGIFIASGILTGLVFCEIVLRIIGMGQLSSPKIPDPVLHHIHPPGFSFETHSVHREYDGFDIHYNAQGLRTDKTKPPLEELKKHPVRIAIMGDSFAEANQVPYEESFCGLLQQNALPGVRFVNFGNGSYSPVIYYLQWKELVSQFQPSHVILMLYSNDIRDDEGYLKNAVFAENGDLLAVPGPGGGQLTRALRKLYIMRTFRKFQLQIEWRASDNKTMESLQSGTYIEENPDMNETSGGYIKKLKTLTEKAGTRLTLTAIPTKYPELMPKTDIDADFAGKCRRWADANGIEFLDLHEAFKKADIGWKNLFFVKDVHLNKAGNKVVAETIIRAFPQYFQQPSAGLVVPEHP